MTERSRYPHHAGENKHLAPAPRRDLRALRVGRGKGESQRTKYQKGVSTSQPFTLFPPPRRNSEGMTSKEQGPSGAGSPLPRGELIKDYAPNTQ